MHDRHVATKRVRRVLQVTRERPKIGYGETETTLNSKMVLAFSSCRIQLEKRKPTERRDCFLYNQNKEIYVEAKIKVPPTVYVRSEQMRIAKVHVLSAFRLCYVIGETQMCANNGSLERTRVHVSR